MDRLEALILPLLLVALGSGGTAWFVAGPNRRKAQAEAAKGDVEAISLFRKQLNEVAEENVRLRHEQDDMRAEFRAFRHNVEAQLVSRDRHIAELTAHVARLELVVIQLGGTVPPRPVVP